MSAQSHALERCRAFIDSNFVESRAAGKRRPLAVTISRQVFSCSHELAEEMIRLLDQDPRLGQDKWALFDRDLVHRILEDHNLPRTLARYMPEDRDHDVSGLINELLGLHPSLWELFHYTCDSIVKLAKVGNVILIGRGAHIITRSLPHVLHVRVVAPFEDRVRRAAQIRGISATEARKLVRQDDQARSAFVRSHFDESLEDPLAYHLTLNTGLLSPREAARLVFAHLQHHRVDKSA